MESTPAWLSVEWAACEGTSLLALSSGEDPLFVRQRNKRSEGPGRPTSKGAELTMICWPHIFFKICRIGTS